MMIFPPRFIGDGFFGEPAIHFTCRELEGWELGLTIIVSFLTIYTLNIPFCLGWEEP